MHFADAHTNHRFHGAKYFSKLDAKTGYWSVTLDETSQLLTTFHSPVGRFCFQRLPFGLNVSQDIFQQHIDIDTILKQCPGTTGIADDITVVGSTEEEHDRNLLNLMVEAHKKWIGLQLQKMSDKTETDIFLWNDIFRE